MKKSRRIAAAGFMALIMMLFSVQVFAAGKIDVEKGTGLTISYQDGSRHLSGAEFAIYLVATADEDGEFTVKEPFAQYHVDIKGLDDETWKALATTLQGFVLRDKITPLDSGRTDKEGILSFPGTGKTMPPGLYLVRGSRHTQGGKRYDPSPFMVILPEPDMENDTWNYDVSVNPKSSITDEPHEPGDSEEPRTVIRKVLKVWKDEGHEKDRPQEIVVQLLRDGEAVETKLLNAGNGWRYTWTGLEDTYTWTVVEKEVAGYTVSVTREGDTFVVTNTYSENPPGTPGNPPSDSHDPSDPQKGDPPNDYSPSNPSDPSAPGGPDSPSGPSNPRTPSSHDTITNVTSAPEAAVSKLPQTGQLWWPVPVLTAAGLLFIIIGLLCRREADCEK